jgi:translin
MVDPTNFQNLASEIEKRLLKKDEIREKLLKLSRQTIKYAGQSIEGFHRNKLDEATERLNQASNTLKQINELLNEDHTTHSIGIINVAMQEFVEAKLFYEIIEGKEISNAENLGVTDQAYLLGIADLIGELRRYSLEKLVEGDVAKAKDFYNIMKELYGTFLQIDFGKNLVPDLRRKKDTARVLVERTLSDLFVAQQSKKLEEKLQEKNNE